MKYLVTVFFYCIATLGIAQSYTNYYTGNLAGVNTNPEGGVCMMGGATEHDEAMKWFLERADGGDVLVLRASGSDGYNDYMYTDLGVSINSVETIVFNSAAAANESYIHTRIQQAEAIWFAGGDQWNYVSFWRDSPIDSLINDGIHNRNIVVGGTSAGMAILGKYYFSAVNGTVTSQSALSNPYNNDVQVDSTHFLEVNYLEDVITDSHYDDPNRKGRHVVFLARILTDTGVAAKGIACNEYTAVCVDENGMARVYGDWPNYDEDAYFLQVNCGLEDFSPEECQPSSPLTWDREGEAVKVYKVHGTNNGANTFDLSDWQTGNGGEWENWYTVGGEFFDDTGAMIDCSSVSIEEHDGLPHTQVFPNPSQGEISLTSEVGIAYITVYSSNSQRVYEEVFEGDKRHVNLKIDLRPGIYFLEVSSEQDVLIHKLIVE